MIAQNRSGIGAATASRQVSRACLQLAVLACLVAGALHTVAIPAAAASKDRRSETPTTLGWSVRVDVLEAEILQPAERTLVAQVPPPTETLTNSCIQQRDDRDCSAIETDCAPVCLIKSPLSGACVVEGNDPACEVSKAAERATCEAAKAAQNLQYEAQFEECLGRPVTLSEADGFTALGVFTAGDETFANFAVLKGEVAADGSIAPESVLQAKTTVNLRTNTEDTETQLNPQRGVIELGQCVSIVRSFPNTRGQTWAEVYRTPCPAPPLGFAAIGTFEPASNTFSNFEILSGSATPSGGLTANAILRAKTSVNIRTNRNDTETGTNPVVGVLSKGACISAEESFPNVRGQTWAKLKPTLCPAT